jgi:hypothetical protein
VSGPAIVALVAEHCGLKAVHVVPDVCRRTGRRGWSNVLVCADGFARKLTKQEANAYAAALPAPAK